MIEERPAERKSGLGRGLDAIIPIGDSERGSPPQIPTEEPATDPAIQRVGAVELRIEQLALRLEQLGVRFEHVVLHTERTAARTEALGDEVATLRGHVTALTPPPASPPASGSKAPKRRAEGAFADVGVGALRLARGTGTLAIMTARGVARETDALSDWVVRKRQARRARKR